MSIKKLIAALLCGIMLTGCATDKPTNNNYNEMGTPTLPAVTPATTTTAATTDATTIKRIEITTPNSTATTTPKKEYPFTTPEIMQILYFYDEWSTVTYYESYPNKGYENVDFTYEIYWSANPNGEKSRCLFNLGEYQTGTLSPAYFEYYGNMGAKPIYFFIRAENEELGLYSDYSEPFSDVFIYEQYIPQPKVHRYTHTFSAPFGVTIIPLYDSANNEISKGIQPTQFEYTYTFICPRCGERRDGWAVLSRFLPYDRDGQDIWFSTSCLYCDYDASGTVYSYASQIS